MTFDAFETVMAWLICGTLVLSALLLLVRITTGPSVLERVVASDALVSVVICALATYVALTDSSTSMAILVSLSLIGFMGSVAVARFVARDRDTPFVPAAPDRLPEDEEEQS